MDLSPDSILLTDRVAVVTGAARGIGASTAVALARFGAHVAVFDKDPTLLPDVVTEIEANGRRCVSGVLDARDDDAVAAFLQRTHDEAGSHRRARQQLRAAPSGPASTTLSPKGEHTLIRENFSTVTNCVRHGIPLMADGGAIINVDLGGGLPRRPGVRVYAAMKAAVEQFTKTLAVEYGHRGFRVNCVAPRHDAHARRRRSGRAVQLVDGGPAPDPAAPVPAMPTNARP